MIAILYATEMEAAPLLAATDAERLADPLCTVYVGQVEGAPILVAVSGMGMASAGEACRQLVTQHAADLVLNVGICGGLAPGMAPGHLYTVDHAMDVDALIAGDTSVGAASHPTPWPGLPAVRLGTVTEALFDSERREAVRAHCELVDMEGAAVARTCARLGVACRLLKGVSDDAHAGGREALRKNLASVSCALAEQVLRDLPALRVRSIRDTGLLARLAGFTRLEHTIFSLPLLFAGAWLGTRGQLPSWRALSLIALVGTGARTFGMAMNRILDRDIDARNPRTAARELPSGRLSLAQGYLVAFLGLAAYLLGCMLLGPVCLALAPVPLIPLTVYALLKRFTIFCHFGIGLCLATAPLGAFVAVTGQVPVQADIWMLAGFTLLWIGGFDIIYALQDMAVDRVLGVKSMPAALGARGAQGVAAAAHGVAMALLYGLWRVTGQGPAAGVALLAAGAMFLAAYWPRLPLAVRFFPLSALACVAGAAVVLLGRYT